MLWLAVIYDEQEALIQKIVSVVGQSQPEMVGIKGFKSSHFKEGETAPFDPLEKGSMGLGAPSDFAVELNQSAIMFIDGPRCLY